MEKQKYRSAAPHTVGSDADDMLGTSSVDAPPPKVSAATGHKTHMVVKVVGDARTKLSEGSEKESSRFAKVLREGAPAGVTYEVVPNTKPAKVEVTYDPHRGGRPRGFK